MIFNGKLADEVLEIITKNPERWDQADWIRPDWADELWASNWQYENEIIKIEPCGTVGCFAGHVAILHLSKTLLNETIFIDSEDCPLLLLGDGTGVGPVSNVAAEALGMTTNAVFPLFAGGNSLDDLKRGVEFLKSIDGTQPWHDQEKEINRRLCQALY